MGGVGGCGFERLVVCGILGQVHHRALGGLARNTGQIRKEILILLKNLLIYLAAFMYWKKDKIKFAKI